MVVTNEGKNRIKDLIAGDIAQAEFGTDGTAASVSDSDLIAPEVTTLNTPVITTGEKLVNATSTMLSTVGNGITFKESVIRMSTGDTLCRSVYPDYEKTSVNEVRETTVVRVN